MHDLHVNISGDRSIGESYIGFAEKKLKECIVLGKPQRKIVFSNGVEVFVQQTETRKEVWITVPPIVPPKKEEKRPEGYKLEGLLFFYGLNYELLQVTDVKKNFIPEAVVCGDGSGDVDYVSGSNLLGDFVRCWEPGDTVTGQQSGASGVITNCFAFVYKYTYKYYTIFGDFIFRDGWLVSSPCDIFTRTCRDNLNREFRTHTKTFGRPDCGWMTVTADESQPYIAYGLPSIIWRLTAVYNGKQVTFDGSLISPEHSRGILKDIPMFFDVWEESGIFYVGMVTNFFLLYKFDKTDNDFKIISVATPPQGLIIGHAKKELYTRTGNYNSNVINYAILGDDGNFSSEEIYETSDSVENVMWNHFKDELYVIFLKAGETIPEDPFQLIDCKWIQRNSHNGWYECRYRCSGSAYSCVCYPCSVDWWYQPPCPEPDGFHFVSSGFSDGTTTWEWTVPVASPAERDVGDPDICWYTYQVVGIIPVPNRLVNESMDVLTFKDGILTNQLEFSGGSYIEGSMKTFNLSNGNICSTCSFNTELPNGYFCQGTLYDYTVQEFVFTADNLGFYLKLDETTTNCYGTSSYSKIVHIGDRDYSPGRSTPPYDHNWTAILKPGTEDSNGKEITPTLVYVNGETGRNIFYGQLVDGVTEIAEEANRAFFQYDVKYYGGV